MDIPMEVLQRKLMEIGKINGDTMNEVVDCIPKLQAQIEKSTAKTMMHKRYFFNPLKSITSIIIKIISLRLKYIPFGNK